MSPENVMEPPIQVESQIVAKLLDQCGCGQIHFAGTDSGLYERHLLFDNVIDLSASDARGRFDAFARSVRDVLSQRWILTENTYASANAKRVHHLSMEFLIGRSLANNVDNMLLSPIFSDAVWQKNIDRAELLEQEPDAGLGNGGLGRLAACFLESMATLALPAIGYGLRYEYGIFKQFIENGWQREQPDNWLRRQDPWEVARPHETVEVKLNCSFEIRGGTLHIVPGQPSSLVGVPFDRPVIGYGGKTINTLRLWAAAASHSFDFQAFSHGEFVAAVTGTLGAESLTRVLYPDDSTTSGQRLRFVQEYFLVACSLADIVRRFRRTNTDWSVFPEKAAIQLNDTHPTTTIPELMRIMLDEAHLEWEQAWDITQRTVGYTNHTLLPEALDKWPVAWFEMMLPRHLEIIYEINGRLLDSVRTKFPGDEEKVRRISLIEEDGERKVRMANLAIVGSHSTNGVAAIHSRLLRTTTVKDLAEMFPERFSNKTNGVAPRLWLLLSNPSLSQIVTEAIGDDWITDLSQLSRLKALAYEPDLCHAFRKAKRQAKAQFADWLKSTSGIAVDPDTIFDAQIKRIHEYKRQLLNALRIVVVYNRLRENPDLKIAPRTFFFSGKAAPAYQLAKLIQMVIFGTSGHRGTPFAGTFIAFIQKDDGVTPTPVISRAILVYNRGRKDHLADGIVITPSHNPPEDGGFKYNPWNGGPADTNATHWIEKRANELLRTGNAGVKRVPYKAALKASTTHREDFALPYVRDLRNDVDIEIIRDAKLKLAVDPLGGAALYYWEPINHLYRLDVSVVNPTLDPTFFFMTVDHDGKIRMDCSSPYAMERLVALRHQYRVAFGNDPDSDRHGIVTPFSGLMNPNHYLAVAIHYLLKHRPEWPAKVAVGKTIVSSRIIDKVVQKLGRCLSEVPVGFKRFAPGLFDGSYCFGGEESVGASFLRFDGSPWTTDKDGPVMDLLAAEITARTGKDPGEHYRRLIAEFEKSYYTRVDAPATPEQKARLQSLSPDAITESNLAREPIVSKLARAPGNNEPIGGVKIEAASGWFAARPSGTENVYKIYAESFHSEAHLNTILAQPIVDKALASPWGQA